MSEPLGRDLQRLHAYVDGELSPRDRREVEKAVVDNPEALQQLHDYEQLRAALQELYGPVAQEPVPWSLRRFNRRTRWPAPLAAAAAGVLLLLGGAGGWLLRGPTTGPQDDVDYVIAEAAVAYTVYTPEVLHPVEVFADQASHLQSWLGKRLGVAFRIPRLTDVDQALVGGRLLSSEYGLGALLMYEDPSGERLVLYVCRDDNGHQASALRFARHDGVSVFYWFDGTLSYALASRLQRAQLQEIARAAYSGMSSSADPLVSG